MNHYVLPQTFLVGICLTAVWALVGFDASVGLHVSDEMTAPSETLATIGALKLLFASVCQ